VATDYRPYSLQGNGYWGYNYDDLGRLLNATLYQSNQPGATIDRIYSWVYAGRTVTAENPLVSYTTQISDVTGQLREVIDPLPTNGKSQGGITYYEYDAFGNLNKITDCNWCRFPLPVTT